MSRLITKMENASARVTSRMMNELVFGTTTATAASATMTIRIFQVWLLIGCRSLPPEQTGRLDREDQRHRRIQGEVGNLREQRLAEVVGQPNDQRADRGAAQAAHAADDHHGKRDRQHLEIEAGIDAEEGAADDAAERREKRA